MSKKVDYKITLPNKIINQNYNPKVIEINGEKITYSNGEPEFYSLKQKNLNILKQGFAKIEDLAYSNNQLKSINNFFLQKYWRLGQLKLYEGFSYNQWMVYKRHDDLLFCIHDVDTSSGKMRLYVTMYQFPFLGGIVDVPDSEIISPEDFGFEYQFHLYNDINEDQ